MRVMNKFLCIISNDNKSIDSDLIKIHDKYGLCDLYEYMIICIQGDQELPDIICGNVVVLLYTEFGLHKFTKKYASLKIIGMNNSAYVNTDRNFLFTFNQIDFVDVKFKLSANKNITFSDNNSVAIKNCQFIGENNGVVWSFLNNLMGISKNAIIFDKCVKKINIKNNTFQSVDITVCNNRNVMYDDSHRVLYDDVCETVVMHNTFSDSAVMIDRKNETIDNFLESGTIESKNY